MQCSHVTSQSKKEPFNLSINSEHTEASWWFEQNFLSPGPVYSPCDLNQMLKPLRAIAFSHVKGQCNNDTKWHVKFRKCIKVFGFHWSISIFMFVLSGHIEKFLFFNINMVTLTSSEDFQNNAVKTHSTTIKLMADCLCKWYLSLLDYIFLLLKKFIFTLLRTYMGLRPIFLSV